MIPLDLARLRVYNSICIFYLSSKINWIQIFEHRINFLQKKKTLRIYLKKIPLNRYVKIKLNTPFIPLQNEPIIILVGPKLGEP